MGPPAESNSYNDFSGGYGASDNFWSASLVDLHKPSSLTVNSSLEETVNNPTSLASIDTHSGLRDTANQKNHEKYLNKRLELDDWFGKNVDMHLQMKALEYFIQELHSNTATTAKLQNVFFKQATQPIASVNLHHRVR